MSQTETVNYDCRPGDLIRHDYPGNVQGRYEQRISKILQTYSTQVRARDQSTDEYYTLTYAALRQQRAVYIHRVETAKLHPPSPEEARSARHPGTRAHAVEVMLEETNPAHRFARPDRTRNEFALWDWAYALAIELTIEQVQRLGAIIDLAYRCGKGEYGD